VIQNGSPRKIPSILIKSNPSPFPVKVVLRAVARQAASIVQREDALNWNSGVFDAGDARRSLVRVKIEWLTPEEENWLLALVAVELYYNARRTAAAIN
jgi:hypothetical protein